MLDADTGVDEEGGAVDELLLAGDDDFEVDGAEDDDVADDEVWDDELEDGAEVVGVGEPAMVVTTSSAACRLPFSFDAQDHRVLLVVRVTSVRSPEATTALVTSAVAQVPLVTAPVLPLGGRAKSGKGALSQVSAVSDHALEVVHTSAPSAFDEPAQHLKSA